ncbi:PAS domain S-box protein [Massilia sp. CCM 9210]|uniref:PAS domain S-box protein n=1 Tax=Massilia scottii TaxID=3057166 RepID=UPI002796D4D3|nr:PAS domain S-box protein [Massilia sp. CCM 9210]MDQ1812457.1 PAS domain S-box protein [Massilia sp. CCM 9210]
MQTVIDDVDDAARVRALEALALLDTPAEERFDRLTRLASAAFDTPMALVSLVDLERQWFKSRVGLAVAETPRSMAFCSHAVAGRELLVVPDTLRDARFCTNPLVTQAPKIRFYAGQPIFSLDGHAVGTLCVLDTAARAFGAAEAVLLRDLASLAEDELNKNTLVSARQAAEQALQQFNAELEARIGERTASLQESNRALTREVAQRKAIEDTLRRSEARNRTIIESSLSAFVSIDTRGCIVDWNAAAEHTFGWTRADVIGLDLATIIIPQRFRAAHHEGMARYLSSGVGRVLNQRIELPACKKSGEEITVEMTISAFPTTEGVLFGAFLHDISARLNAQGALQQQQKQLDAVLDTIDVGVVACTADGSISASARPAKSASATARNACAPLPTTCPS